jgi:hypothetical protein
MADDKGFIYKANRKRPVLHISEDGTITRADTRLDLCKAMTIREAVKVIGDIL